MEPPPIDILAWWQHLENMIRTKSIVPIQPFYLQKLFEDAEMEKNAIETEQIIARVMYKPCFSHKEVDGKICVRKKFHYLSEYYLEMQEYDKYGLTIMSSIIREWPVPIYGSSVDADERKPLYIWDRAPISIASKDGSIRKNGDQYVIRVLALDESAIGSTLLRANSSTQLMFIDENGQENFTSAYIIELNREGGDNGRRREAPKEPPPERKKAKGTRLKNREDTESPALPQSFENGFQNLPGNDGKSIVSTKPGKVLPDYIDEDSRNIIFSITNISIIDPKIRNSITQKYLLKTDFEFLFTHRGNTFAVRSVDYHQHLPSDYPVIISPISSTRSMTFEVSSNASTHWKKTFAAIWDNLYLYYLNRGELGPEELAKGRSKDENEKMLGWGKVKDMIRHFISCRSEFHVRPLSDTEMRTITRMILVRRLVKHNSNYVKNYSKKDGKDKDYSKKEGKEKWIIDNLQQQDKEQILRWFQQFDSRTKRHFKIPIDKTFTQYLNSELQSIQLIDRCPIWQSDFTENMLVLTSGESEQASCSIHSWLHAVSEIIAGPTLHFGCPKTSIRMFNDNMITLRSAESAKRTVKNILSLAESGKRTAGANVLLIRIDEREEFRLLFEMISPGKPEDPYHFGYFNTKAIKETKLPLNKQQDQEMNKSDLEKAIRDGVINNKTKQELCGLFAVLKTGYLGKFHKIVVSSEGKLHLFPIFKTGEESSSPVYPYDFTPAEMVDKEINPLIGPMSKNTPTNNEDEVFSEIESAITQSIASMRIKEHQIRRVQQLQPQFQPSPVVSPLLQQHTFTAPHTPPQFHLQQSPQPQFAYPMQPIVQYNVQHNHSHNHYEVAPPPYSSQTDIVTYANQGVQAQQPFTPPEQGTSIDSLVGFNNPSFQML